MSRGTRPPFRYYGHSTITFELPGGEVVMIDPWVTGNPACPPELHRPERVDAMLITHPHDDHFGDVLELAERLQPKVVVANYEVCMWLAGKGIEGTAPMNPGGSQEVLGCRVTMVRAEHSTGLTDEGRLIYGGVAAGYVVQMPDGYTFHHAGDTALYGDMKLTAELYRPELGFVPIGDLFTMGPLEAAYACKFLNLRQVVPIHYGTFPPLTGTPEAFERQLAELGVDCDVVTVAPGAEL
jgi:L-ascorbate metabolism protein UlaG (beta-lactamase superfamily)